jgi:hypothetical protein
MRDGGGEAWDRSQHAAGGVEVSPVGDRFDAGPDGGTAKMIALPRERDRTAAALAVADRLAPPETDRVSDR